jgi:hypothetical protein
MQKKKIRFVIVRSLITHTESSKILFSPTQIQRDIDQIRQKYYTHPCQEHVYAF